jgi:hypothetical protein
MPERQPSLRLLSPGIARWLASPQVAPLAREEQQRNERQQTLPVVVHSSSVRDTKLKRTRLAAAVSRGARVVARSCVDGVGAI